MGEEGDLSVMARLSGSLASIDFSPSVPGFQCPPKLPLSGSFSLPLVQSLTLAPPLHRPVHSPRDFRFHDSSRRRDTPAPGSYDDLRLFRVASRSASGFSLPIAPLRFLSSTRRHAFLDRVSVARS